MASAEQLACDKSEFRAYYHDGYSYHCFYQTTAVIAQRYFLPLDIGILFVTVILSILIRKNYAWILLNQTLLHLFSHCLSYAPTRSVIFKVISNAGVLTTIIKSTSMITPYVSMALLTLSRYIALYFPHFYDRWVTNKTIFPIILLWDLLCCIPYWGFLCAYFYTDFQECPQYSKNVCNIVNTYFKYGPSYVNTSYFYLKQHFDLERMKNDSINYDECFNYKSCLHLRAPPYQNLIGTLVSMGLATLMLVLSIFLFYRIITHLKIQSKINRNSMMTSFKIAIILLFQTIYFFIDGSFNTIQYLYLSRVLALFSSSVYATFIAGIYPGLYYFFITIDSLLIMFLLSDYRYYLLYFIPKRQSSHVSVISSNTS